MKILALETSAAAASCAICEDETLIAQNYQATGLTHSATLMPMVEAMLQTTGLTLEQMDVVAVAAGPGSFTGIRIGVSTAKGLAWALEKPCAACSTLESMAWQVACLGNEEHEICAVMDARRQQVYNARFAAGPDGNLLRLSPDRAISLEDLTREIKSSGKMQIFVGDGSTLCYNTLQQTGLNVQMAPPHLRLQSSYGVARAALELARADRLTSAAALAPNYHRLSQAERERLQSTQRGVSSL